ncbi:tetratricopeptide repeat protein [Limnoglobus roseus]|uniref:Tetratricopeptide repeat protein n=1 Tax=Limnoglobus roseus TaxID=2598579 RepID=A0A5C1A4D0_9BACT|nr:hypothetical protein [Limnoglobus roseus]QEL13173.1 tetratricopeptide repeat protein [Limnoglobus roseus]
MSMMLSLSFHAWNHARQAIKDGRSADALRWLEQVATAAELTSEELAEAHRLAAGLLLNKARFAKARRHLRAADGLEPDHAGTHFQMGLAFEGDPYGCDRRAAKAFRRAIKLDPSHSLSWAHLARSAVRIHRDSLAKAAIRTATQLAPTDARVLSLIVETLRESGRLKAALRIVTKARFLAPHDAEVLAVWNRVRFEMARAAQHAKRTPKTTTSPHVLPFVRIVDAAGHKRVVRRDMGGVLSGPHVMRMRRDS